MPVNLCLDLGTAYSKASAWTIDTNHALPLRIGDLAGSTGFIVPTAVTIAKDGRMYFGNYAVAEGRRTGTSAFSDLKRHMTHKRIPLDEVSMPSEHNPTRFKLSVRQVICLYMAFLSHIASKALDGALKRPGVRESSGGKIRTTFTMPVFKGEQDKHLRRELGVTTRIGWELNALFSQGLESGLDLRVALQRMRALERRASRRTWDSVELVEPLAAIASRMATYDPARNTGRRLSMLIDVGAGTVDFGIFVSGLKDENMGVHPIAEAKYSLPVGGNDIDDALVRFILEKAALRGTSESRVEAILREQARDLKERLLESGDDDPVPVADAGTRLTKTEFLDSEPLQMIAQKIEKEFWKRLSSVDGSWLELASKLTGRGIEVYLSGGGAKLPFLRKMIPVNAPQTLQQSPQFYIRVANENPNWAHAGRFRRTWQQVGEDYPQMAVSLGGAVFGAGVNQYLALGDELSHWAGAMRQ